MTHVEVEENHSGDSDVETANSFNLLHSTRRYQLYYLMFYKLFDIERSSKFHDLPCLCKAMRYYHNKVIVVIYWASACVEAISDTHYLDHYVVLVS